MNNKAQIDFIDLKYNHLPMFISNPGPDFIIKEKTHLMLLVQHNLTHTEQELKKKGLFENKNIDQQIKYQKKMLATDVLNKYYKTSDILRKKVYKSFLLIKGKKTKQKKNFKTFF